MINHSDCFCGAFIDGFENNGLPFDKYKVVKNCNCIITSKPQLNINNKHNAIVFYKSDIPVRLMVINQKTDVNQCITDALNQELNGYQLKDIYEQNSIERKDVDLQQKPVIKQNFRKEIDVGSCNRPSLLENMLQGVYTESNTDFGKDGNNNNFLFFSNLNIEYELLTDDEYFAIQHHCAFINSDLTRVIPLQDNSLLNIDEITNQYKTGTAQRK